MILSFLCREDIPIGEVADKSFHKPFVLYKCKRKGKKGMFIKALYVPSTGSRKIVPVSPSISTFPASSLISRWQMFSSLMCEMAMSSAILSIYFVGVPSAPVPVITPASGVPTRGVTALLISVKMVLLV